MKTKVIQLSLKLFNAVPSGEKQTIENREALSMGLFIEDTAAYAQNEILSFYKEKQLSGEQINATFHKSWKVIQETKREELFLHQVLHYTTTYGTDFSSDFVYFPCEYLEIPELKQLALKLIRGLASSELIEKALCLLRSGMALEESTLDDLIKLLSLLGHTFDSLDDIKNKEALVKLVDKTGIYPKKPEEFLRYLVYLATDSTLLIKNKETIAEIKRQKLNYSFHFKNYDLKILAQIFNRFKPIFLAFKSHKANIPYINKISKLSKEFHQPMQVDVLNTITSIEYSEVEIKNALKRANIFRKVRLFETLNTRINKAKTFLYRIRNGKAFVKEKKVQFHQEYYSKIQALVYEDLKHSLRHLKGKKIFYPNNIDYALPKSEKMYVGNVPVGSKIIAKQLVAGVYWENQWGARDLDLSSISLAGKVGWNSDYKANGLMYSGDTTDAPNGATELLYAKNQKIAPSLSLLNIYSGAIGCKFKFIIGEASDIAASYMFDPNELIFEAEAQMNSRQKILGLFLPEEEAISFTLIDTGFGNLSVSSSNLNSENARIALYYQYLNPLRLRQLLQDVGALLLTEGAFDIDLRPGALNKKTLIDLFNPEQG